MWLSLEQYRILRSAHSACRSRASSLSVPSDVAMNLEKEDAEHCATDLGTMLTQEASNVFIVTLFQIFSPSTPKATANLSHSRGNATAVSLACRRTAL